MKKQVVQQVKVTVDVCNICNKDIKHRDTTSLAGRYRIPMVNNLLHVEDFDAHDACINRVVREAFKKYV